MDVWPFVAIKPRMHKAYQGELVSRYIREIMMLHVVAHIESDVIVWPVVWVRLMAFFEQIMLGDEVPCHWMNTHRDDSTNQHVHIGLEAEEVDDYRIEDYLNHGVDNFQTGGGFGATQHRPEGIEEGLQEHPDELEKRIPEHQPLPFWGEIWV